MSQVINEVLYGSSRLQEPRYGKHLKRSKVYQSHSVSGGHRTRTAVYENRSMKERVIESATV